MNSISWQPIAAHGGSQELPGRKIIHVLAQEIRGLWSAPEPRSAGWTRLESVQVAELLASERQDQPPAAAAAARRRRAARRYRWQLTQPPRRVFQSSASTRTRSRSNSAGETSSTSRR